MYPLDPSCPKTGAVRIPSTLHVDAPMRVMNFWTPKRVLNPNCHERCSCACSWGCCYQVFKVLCNFSDDWRIEMKCAFPGLTATRCCSCWIINWSHIATHTLLVLRRLLVFFFLLGTLFEKHNTPRFKSDQDEMWHDSSSSKYASIDGIGFFIWRHTFKICVYFHPARLVGR